MSETILIIIGICMIFGGMIFGIYHSTIPRCHYEDKGLIIAFCGLGLFITGLILGR